jgi:hypothetical protein
VVPVDRTDSNVDAIAFFNDPLREGEALDWSFTHRWPGFFDTFRSTGEDFVATTIVHPAQSIELRVALPHGYVIEATGLHGRREVSADLTRSTTGTEASVRVHQPEVGDLVSLRFRATNGAQRS